MIQAFETNTLVRTKKKQKAEKKKKHTSVVVVKNPGEHTQIDVKYQIHLLKK